MYFLFLSVFKMGIAGVRDFHVRVFAVLIVALSSLSFKERPFSDEMICLSLKMSFSNGWLSIKCHSFIRICFKLSTDGSYLRY